MTTLFIIWFNRPDPMKITKEANISYNQERHVEREREREGLWFSDLLTHGVAFVGDIGIWVELRALEGLKPIAERQSSFKLPRVSYT